MLIYGVLNGDWNHIIISNYSKKKNFSQIMKIPMKFYFYDLLIERYDLIYVDIYINGVYEKMYKCTEACDINSD